jgi:hypothetical protein
MRELKLYGVFIVYKSVDYSTQIRIMPDINKRSPDLINIGCQLRILALEKIVGINKRYPTFF